MLTLGFNKFCEEKKIFGQYHFDHFDIGSFGFVFVEHIPFQSCYMRWLHGDMLFTAKIIKKIFIADGEQRLSKPSNKSKMKMWGKPANASF